jgi:predicted secreted protein
LLAIGKVGAEPVLRAAWPNGNSGGALARTGWRAKIAAKGCGRTSFFGPRGGAVFLIICATVLFAGLSFGGRSQHEVGDIAALTTARVAACQHGFMDSFIAVVILAGPITFADYAG